MVPFAASFVSNSFRRRQALRKARTRPSAAATAPTAPATPARRGVNPVAASVTGPASNGKKKKKK